MSSPPSSGQSSPVANNPLSAQSPSAPSPDPILQAILGFLNSNPAVSQALSAQAQGSGSSSSSHVSPAAGALSAPASPAAGAQLNAAQSMVNQAIQPSGHSQAAAQGSALGGSPPDPDEQDLKSVTEFLVNATRRDPDGRNYDLGGALKPFIKAKSKGKAPLRPEEDLFGPGLPGYCADNFTRPAGKSKAVAKEVAEIMEMLEPIFIQIRWIIAADPGEGPLSVMHEQAMLAACYSSALRVALRAREHKARVLLANTINQDDKLSKAEVENFVQWVNIAGPRLDPLSVRDQIQRTASDAQLRFTAQSWQQQSPTSRGGASKPGQKGKYRKASPVSAEAPTSSDPAGKRESQRQ